MEETLGMYLRTTYKGGWLQLSLDMELESFSFSWFGVLQYLQIPPINVDNRFEMTGSEKYEAMSTIVRTSQRVRYLKRLLHRPVDFEIPCRAINFRSRIHSHSFLHVLRQLVLAVDFTWAGDEVRESV